MGKHGMWRFRKIEASNAEHENSGTCERGFVWSGESGRHGATEAGRSKGFMLLSVGTRAVVICVEAARQRSHRITPIVFAECGRVAGASLLATGECRSASRNDLRGTIETEKDGVTQTLFGVCGRLQRLVCQRHEKAARTSKTAAHEQRKCSAKEGAKWRLCVATRSSRRRAMRRPGAG
jgi:hypothetical protein